MHVCQTFNQHKPWEICGTYWTENSGQVSPIGMMIFIWLDLLEAINDSVRFPDLIEIKFLRAVQCLCCKPHRGGERRENKNFWFCPSRNSLYGPQVFQCRSTYFSRFVLVKSLTNMHECCSLITNRYHSKLLTYEYTTDLILLDRKGLF